MQKSSNWEDSPHIHVKISLSICLNNIVFLIHLFLFRLLTVKKKYNVLVQITFHISAIWSKYIYIHIYTNIYICIYICVYIYIHSFLKQSPTMIFGTAMSRWEFGRTIFYKLFVISNLIPHICALDYAGELLYMYL